MKKLRTFTINAMEEQSNPVGSQMSKENMEKQSISLGTGLEQNPNIRALIMFFHALKQFSKNCI